MSFHDDPDLNDAELETRLRRIAAGPAREVPPSLYRRLKEVTVGSGARSVNGVRLEPVRLGGHRRAGLRSARALAALAAVLLIAVSAAGLLIAIRGLQPAATWTLHPDGGQGEWTGVQWHDITDGAGGIAGPLWVQSSRGSGTGGVVRWSGGFATMGGDFNLWLSSDGLTWRRSSSGLKFPDVVAVRGGLLVAGSSSDGTSRSLSFTTDGQTWTPVTPPFDFLSVGLVAGDPGVVVVHTTPNTGIPAGSSDIFFTTDAKNWTQAQLPNDLAAGRNVIVAPFIHGFVATGEVPDPNGSMTITTDAGNVTSYAYHSWISPDGIHWSVYDPTLPSTGFSSNTQPWPDIQRGRLGAGDGLIYSTDGGVTWLADHDLIPEWPLDGELLGEQTVSDGSRIVMAAGAGQRFYVSEGDGDWTRLQQGGDVASLPAAGHLVLLPNGVLWITADRVYFGQGLSGVVPQGTIGPPAVASPSGPVGPTPAVSIGPTTLPTDTTIAPPAAVSPNPTMASTGFTTQGVTSSWAGFNGAALEAGSPMHGSTDRPGSGVARVLRCRGGFVATGSVTLFGQTSPSLGLWTSPDGETWTPVTSIDAASVIVSVAPAGLVAMAFDSQATGGPASPQSVWTSVDGLTWRDAGTSNLPGALVSIAGTASEIVATVSVSTGTGKAATGSFLVEFSTDGLNWTPETVDDLSSGLEGYGLPPHVQANDGHFYLMGSTGPIASSTGIILVSSQVKDEMWLSDDGKTWTRSGGGYSMLADFIDFGRDGLLLHTNADAVPGANGQAYSSDGGKTWHDDAQYGPLGQATCQGSCGTGPDGAIASNGTAFVAVMNGGKQAWLSYDAHTWTPISWNGGGPSSAGYGGFGGFVVMPRGVLLDGYYDSAH